MDIQKVSFTSSAFDKVRLNKQIEPKSGELSQGTDSELSVVTTDSEISDNQKNMVITEPKSHKARNWTVGLGAAAVLTALGVVAGKHGYLGEGVEKMLKGAKKEAGELIDDITETTSESVNRIVPESHEIPAEEGMHSVLGGKISDDSEPVVTVLDKVDDKISPDEILNAAVVFKNPDSSAHISDEIIEITPVLNREVSSDSPLSAVSAIYGEIPAAKLSVDGKFRIPSSLEELDIPSVRKYLKMNKVKIPRKLRTLPEFELKSVLGDFNPESVNKSDIIGGVYTHKLPKGEQLEVHYDATGDNIVYIERLNKKGYSIGCASYSRGSEGGNLAFVEHPNGFNYSFDQNGVLSYGFYNLDNKTYVYDCLNNLERIDENVGKSISRQTYISDGKIRHSEYYVAIKDVGDVQKSVLVKMDNYVNNKNTSENFYINGDADNYIYVKKKKTLDSLKFWQSDWFKSITKKLDRIVLEEEEY